MFQWKDKYNLGVMHLDEQHKKLFEIANRAYSVLKDDFSVDKYDKIIEVIGELKEYTVFHFKSEEEYMKEIKHRKFLSHKIEHDEFINKISEIDLNKIDHNQNEAIMDILKFVYNWIDKHILITDKLYENK